MCLAIYKPAGRAVERQHLANGFSGNAHGAGFAVRQDDNTVLICKGFFSFEHFLKEYLKHSENQSRQAIIHFRWATHGEQTPFNCHPWALGESRMIEIPGVPHAEVAPAAMVHNGVLSHRSDNSRSDTGYYVLDILDPLYRDWPGLIGNAIMCRLIGEDINASNKFVLLGGDGAYSIVNYAAGTAVDEIWFSNCGFRTSSNWSRGVWSGWDEDSPTGYWGGGYKSIAADAARDDAAAPSDSGDDRDPADAAADAVSFFPDSELMPFELEELTRLGILFPEVVAEFKDAEDVFAFFKGARAAYRRSNPESARLSKSEIDQLMRNEGYVDALIEAGGHKLLAT